MDKKEIKMTQEVKDKNFEDQKLELIRLRIQNKFYEREEILQKVVQELYEQDLKNK